MMDRDQFAPKEIAIYQAVLDLMCSGADLSNVKVADIAEKAGIGKGTVYEYFDSKKQMVAKTLLYSMRSELRSAWSRIEVESGFEAKCRAMLAIVAQGLGQRFSLGVMMSGNAFQDLKSLLGAQRAAVEANRTLITQMVGALLKEGVKEGVIPPQRDPQATQMAFFGTVAGFIYSLNNIPDRTDDDTRRAMDRAYAMLVKALS